MGSLLQDFRCSVRVLWRNPAFSMAAIGVTARDPAVFFAVPLLLSLVALIGVWLPARRAARVDPAIALRAE